jgi:hypothetical protein
LREKRRLRVFENKVLGKIFGTRREEVTRSGENYILRSLMIVLLTKYFLVDQIKNIEMNGHVARVEERRGL